MRLGPIAMV